MPGFLTSHSHLPFQPRSAGFLHSSSPANGPVRRRCITRKNKTPRIAGSFGSAHQIARIGGTEAIRARLLIVSRFNGLWPELSVMHRWRTELFRHLVHGPDVEIAIIEQRQVNLLAHRSNVGRAYAGDRVTRSIRRHGGAGILMTSMPFWNLTPWTTLGN